MDGHGNVARLGAFRGGHGQSPLADAADVRVVEFLDRRDAQEQHGARRQSATALNNEVLTDRG